MEWNKLLVDRQSRPPRLRGSEFISWLEERRIFVSSVMNDYMQQARDAVREWIYEHDAIPMMWEELAPQDRKPEDAYLAGVRESDIFVLLLGTGYGKANELEDSAIYQETQQAREVRIPRLVFESCSVDDSDRDTELDQWVQSMYDIASLGEFKSPEDLVSSLERRLQETAAEHQEVWIKLDGCLFPGRVDPRTTSSGRDYTIRARVEQHAVHRQLEELVSQFGRGEGTVLTCGVRSEEVNVKSVEVHTEAQSERQLEILCESSSSPGTTRVDLLPTVQANEEKYTPADQAELWIRKRVLGQEVEALEQNRLLGVHMPSEEVILPELISEQGATGRAALGLARVFIVETVIQEFGGSFNRLEFGVPSSQSIPVRMDVSDSKNRGSIQLQGEIPLG